LRDRSWKEIGPALGSGSQFRNAHKTKRATLVLASVALLAAVAHVTNKKSTNKNLFSDRGHPGCLPPQVTRVPKKPLAAVHWANGCQLPLLNTARGGLRVVANVMDHCPRFDATTAAVRLRPRAAAATASTDPTPKWTVGTTTRMASPTL